MNPEASFTIIPKAKDQSPLKNTILLIFSVALFLIPIGIFLLFQYYVNPQALEQKKKLIEELNAVDSSENLVLRNNVAEMADKISDLSGLLKNHKLASQAFDFVRAICHKKVQFVSLELNTKTAAITVEAVTDQFRTFGEQLLALRDNSNIKSFSAKSAALNDKGVSFGFEMFINQQLLLPGPNSFQTAVATVASTAAENLAPDENLEPSP